MKFHTSKKRLFLYFFAVIFGVAWILTSALKNFARNDVPIDKQVRPVSIQEYPFLAPTYINENYYHVVKIIFPQEISSVLLNAYKAHEFRWYLLFEPILIGLGLPLLFVRFLKYFPKKRSPLTFALLVIPIMSIFCFMLFIVGFMAYLYISGVFFYPKVN